MIAVVGATGTVGRQVVAELVRAGAPVRELSRTAATVDSHTETARFSVTEPATWDAAFTGAEAMFLMRPPQIVRVRRDLLPAIAAAGNAGVRKVVFLSVLGAERNPLLPHRHIEKFLTESGMAATLLRAGNFMQNLPEVHGTDIRGGQLAVPAGDSAMSYVDADDVAAVAARCLLETGHEGRAYDVTGPEAITHHHIAEVLSEATGHPVRYTRPGIAGYWLHAARTGMPRGLIAATTVLYNLARVGIGSRVSEDTSRVLGRPATDIRTFALRLHQHGTW